MTKFWLRISLGSDFRSEKSEKLLSWVFFLVRRLNLIQNGFSEVGTEDFTEFVFPLVSELDLLKFCRQFRFDLWYEFASFLFFGKTRFTVFNFEVNFDSLFAIYSLFLFAFCSHSIEFVCKHPYRNNQECSCFLFVFSHFKDLSLSLIFPISVRMLTHLVD